MSGQGKRALVIGGTGFIGGRLAERLILEQQAAVRVTVRDWRKAVWISRTSAELVPGDVMDRDSMSAAMRDCDTVFHCASSQAESGGYMATNREGTTNVIAACVAAGVRRLVYVSTVAVHAAKPGVRLSSRSPLLQSGRDYSDSKVVAERLVDAAHESGGLETVIIRPTYVWGPRSSLFTTRQLREMKAGTFKYVDAGLAIANAVYIDNLVDALVASGASSLAEGRRFLITDGAAYTWRDLFEPYARLLGIGAIPSVPSAFASSRWGGRAVDHSGTALGKLLGERSIPVRAVRRAVKMTHDRLRKRFVDSWELNKFAYNELADIEEARRVLGYSPRHDLASGMAETILWVRDQLGFELGLEET